MENERKITEKIIAAAKAGLRGVVVLKHSDRATAGIPDMSLSILGFTAWAEIKFLRAGAKLKDIIGMDQLVLCHELATTCNGRCWFLVYEEEGRAVPRSPKKRRLTIWQPRALAQHLYPNVSGPSVEGWNRIGREPIEVESFQHMGGGLAGALNAYGAVTIKGWPFDAVVWLMKHSVAAVNEVR